MQATYAETSTHGWSCIRSWRAWLKGCCKHSSTTASAITRASSMCRAAGALLRLAGQGAAGGAGVHG
eukprot:1160436-Pelagomonas_calceolata.AAC.13